MSSWQIKALFKGLS